MGWKDAAIQGDDYNVIAKYNFMIMFTMIYDTLQFKTQNV